jgi:hypothetical protein
MPRLVLGATVTFLSLKTIISICAQIRLKNIFALVAQYIYVQKFFSIYFNSLHMIKLNGIGIKFNEESYCADKVG